MGYVWGPRYRRFLGSRYSYRNTFMQGTEEELRQSKNRVDVSQNEGSYYLLHRILLNKSYYPGLISKHKFSNIISFKLEVRLVCHSIICAPCAQCHSLCEV